MKIEVEELNDPGKIDRKKLDMALVRALAKSNDMSEKAVLRHRHIKLDTSQLSVGPEDFQ